MSDELVDAASVDVFVDPIAGIHRCYQGPMLNQLLDTEISPVRPQVSVPAIRLHPGPAAYVNNQITGL